MTIELIEIIGELFFLAVGAVMYVVLPITTSPEWKEKRKK